MSKTKKAAEVAPAAETSPFYLVWNERGRSPTVKHPTYQRATAEAARLARENIGTFFVLAVVGTAVMTTLETTEFRFDPSGDRPEPTCHECGRLMDDCECVPF